ncbi:MAG: class I SAM-dependent RNA methyltransferase [Oscillospiraceae bacterium]|jgi:putative N6-adenine-specific DNA methylase|nr:class I SAM-dependent RNA methyltransferase [Oscillospiraceae bacterium]
MGELITLCAPCLFGLEGLVADELRRLKFEDVRAENGRVFFAGGESDVARANVTLSMAERVLLVLGQAHSATFDELFEATRALPWERYIPKNGAFPVTGHSLNSALHSIPDCQRIVKKAIARRLSEKYGAERHPEDGAEYKIRFAIMNDTVTLSLDTTGAGLHKRGYRPVSVAAPLRETLAAAMVRLARYRGRDRFVDPFCGSGTIAIEAALAALNRAPGLNRDFAAQHWTTLPADIWSAVKDEARAREFNGAYDITGGDIDPKSIEIAKEHARRAGVAGQVKFEVADARAFSPTEGGGVIVSNPPYGERVMEKRDAETLYREFGAAVRNLKDWQIYILSSHTEFERSFGKVASKKRKLYNGMIKCDLYMYT